ncbi:MAG: TetR/AcrR family transcriptional regulator [Deltaproteobacteria bacterium]|nr:TetR/AcrR family transcriptional regulator [Deltaproteobacteria bacterium]
MKYTRTYRMGARAEAAAATHRRILEATLRLSGTRPWEDVALADVARAARVTVQTVLRRFGSKDGLAVAATELGLAEVRRARWRAAPGDVDTALRDLAAHYEEWGARSLRFLAQEEGTPAMRRITHAGRALHHAWVDHVFGPWLSRRRGLARARLRAHLIAATDVYAWKIWRRDLRQSTRATAATLRGLVGAILNGKGG